MTFLPSALLLVTVLVSPILAVTGVVSLPDFDGFLQKEFSNFEGVTMNGQTLSIDFVFSKPFAMNGGPVWSELFLQTGPHNPPNPNGDYPYRQYVVFGAGTQAFVIDENGLRLDVPMADWQGGTASSPAATLGVLSTDRGWAGADMIAYPGQGAKVAGIHYDLVLPNTGQALFLGRIAVKLEGVPETGTPPADPPLQISAISVTDRTASEATIHWSTGGVETVVEYGATTAYGQQATAQALEGSEYSASLSELDSNTTYHFRITSRDENGNLVTSEDNAFLTGFTIPDSGGISRTTDGGQLLAAISGSAQVSSGSVPSGLVILGNRQPGFLVSELAAPATPLMTSGRTYIEVSADRLVNTGIAISNPNDVDATINFEIRNSQGNTYQSGSFTLKGIRADCDPSIICNHLSRFVDEAPFLSGRNTEGTLSFTSTAPISVIAIRGFLNERTPSDFLMANLPLADLSSSAVPGVRVIPRFVVGNGMRTQLVLTNPTGVELRGTAEFRDSAGVPVFVKSGSDDVHTVNYSVAPNGAQKFTIAEALLPAVSGSVRVVPADQTPAPTPLAILSYKPGEFTVAEAAVPATMGTAFRMYAQLASYPQINTAVAIANATDTRGVVTLSFTDLAGNPIASGSWQLEPRGQIMELMDTLIPSLKGMSAQGVLRITTDLSNVSVAGFRQRYSERQPLPDFLFTAIAPVLENSALSSQKLVFPQLVYGGGFTTEMILYSGTAGGTLKGDMIFVRPDGIPFVPDIH